MIKKLEESLARAEANRTKIRKRVEAGAVHESHLSHAEGLVDGFASSLEIAKEYVKATESRIRELEAKSIDVN